jgi:hypothetical protein
MLLVKKVQLVPPLLKHQKKLKPLQHQRLKNQRRLKPRSQPRRARLVKMLMKSLKLS